MFLFPEYVNHTTKNTKKNFNETNDFLIEQEVWKFTISILDRFDFNYETIGLAICFYLKLMISSHLVDKRPLYLKKFHISGCVYLAAKTIEL